MLAAGLIPLITSAVIPVLDRLVPDKNAREKAQMEIEAKLTETIATLNMEQVRTNQMEAQHRSIFVAGWRPFIGWTCGAGLAWCFLGQPIAEWAALLAGEPGLEVPQINTSILFEMTLAMLGLGGLRTFEKLKGVAV